VLKRYWWVGEGLFAAPHPPSGPFAVLHRAHLARATLLTASCMLASLVVPSAPASALIARGHVFGSAFGAQGGGDGQFEGPSEVAADEATGEVYVVDSGNERVEVFKPGVGGAYEYVSQFKVRSPGAIAVDNSSGASDPSRGDVYVVGAEEKGEEPSEHDIVYEYSPSEAKVVEKLEAFKSGEGEEEFSDISGLAVDSSGVLWVYWEEEGTIDGFAKRLNKAQTKAQLVWEPSLRRTPEVESKFVCSARPGFAVAPGDELWYTAYEREDGSEECPGENEETPHPVVVGKLNGAQPTPGVVTREVDHESTTGVAVDPSNGDVYLDNGSSVTAFSPAGLLIQRFGGGEVAGGSGVAVDAATGDVFVPELGEDKIDVFKPEEQVRAPVLEGVSSQNLTPTSAELRAQIDPGGAQSEYYFQYGTADCATSPSACAQVPVPAGELGAGFGDREVSVEVKGLVPATAYYYRVLASNSAGHTEGVPSPNTFTTLPSPSVLPDGRAWEMVSPPEKHGAAIESITRYSGGSIQASQEGGALAWLASGPVVSEPQGNRSFEATQLLSSRGPEGWETQSLETPHEQGRGLELPSPGEYHFFSPDLSLSLLQPVEPTRQVGGVVEHPALSTEAGEKTMYLRHDPPASPGYLPLVTAANDAAHSRFGGALEFLDATSDLGHVVFESKVGLTAGAPGAAGLYEWQAGTPLELVSVLPDGLPAPDEPASVEPVEPSLGDGGGLNARNAISSDGTRVFWSESVSFVPEHLYLRDTQTGESVLVNAAQGQDATAPGTGGQTLPEPADGGQEVHFQSASSDGSRVFFTDTARLSEESGQEPTGEESPTDLYEFEVTSQPGEPLGGRLTDLTPDSTAGSADVLNLIPGASADGSDVYFVANGVLAPGATPGACPRNPEQAEGVAPTATCNLYVSRPDPEALGQRETRFIAALSYLDAADWGAGISGSGTASNLSPSQDLSAVTASVSANGQYLAFMSEQSLTGYDNQDASGGQADEEVFRYDASSGRLVCASCNPGSENAGGGEGFKRPHGVFDTQLSGEGFGLLVDRPEIWKQRWLAASIPGWAFNIIGGGPAALYQPRYLSDSGRLFFDSPDELVPAATNGKQDVYEYEPDQVGSCQSSSGCIGLISSGSSSEESAFLDASENGDDVFFLTAAQLVPADQDQAFDIYDAHVCSESSPCHSSQTVSTTECETSQACRPGSVPSSQVPATPASAAYTGPANPAEQAVSATKNLAKPANSSKPLTRAQKLANALRACRKLRRKHKRALCEAQARERYAAKAKHKASKAKTKTTIRHSARPDEGR
jgi:hypothetical protein